MAQARQLGLYNLKHGMLGTQAGGQILNPQLLSPVLDADMGGSGLSVATGRMATLPGTLGGSASLPSSSGAHAIIRYMHL